MSNCEDKQFAKGLKRVWTGSVENSAPIKKAAVPAAFYVRTRRLELPRN